MTTKEVLNAVATLPSDQWAEIQNGIAELIAARFTDGEVNEIRMALKEAEADFQEGRSFTSDEIRSRLGLQ